MEGHQQLRQETLKVVSLKITHRLNLTNRYLDLYLRTGCSISNSLVRVITSTMQKKYMVDTVTQMLLPHIQQLFITTLISQAEALIAI